MKRLKKIVLAPDSFKGTMSSMKICGIMEHVIKQYYPDAHVVKMPVADGGEGIIECFMQAHGGRMVTLQVKGPYFETVDSCYAIMTDGETAVVEAAKAAGFRMTDDRKDPSLTTTFGVGQLIGHAVENGCKTIIVGLGGSCTNDGGAGMAAALGVRFYDRKGHEFVPVGGTLDRIAKIDMSGRIKELGECHIVALYDVDNPLYGMHGAAYEFAPQKGAGREMVRMLDNNLTHLADQIEKDLEKAVGNVPGAGAAGGMGAGAVAFLEATLEPGIETILDALEFDNLLEGTDVVFTGEGRIDGQSLRGKVVVGVARRAKLKTVPVIAVVGDIGDDIENIYDEGVTAIVSTNRVALPFEQAQSRCEKDLALTMDMLMKLYAS